MSGHAGWVKVLVVGTGGELEGSGITTVADQMVSTLQAMGHQPVRLVAGARRRRRPNRLNIENLMAALCEAVAIARAARATEVVWLHTFGVPTLPAVRTLVQVLAVRAVRRPVIVELHAFALADHLEAAGRVQRFVLRRIGHLSRHTVVLHEGDAAALRRLVVPEEVAVLPNWVEVPPERTPLPPGPPYTAVFVGGLVARKGVPQLLEAMRLLEDVPIRLRLVGGAGDEGEAAAGAMRSSAADLVDADRVHFVGALDAAEVRAELVAAHLFLLPSQAEGMPMAMLEAMAEGRCVIAAGSESVAAIISSSDCGTFLSSPDATSLAREIRHAVQDPEWLQTAGENGHRIAAAEYSGDRAAGRIASILGPSAVGSVAAPAEWNDYD
jgi:glycosyltransferase involved in cell wall biosynthesis